MFPIAHNRKQLIRYIKENVECRLDKDYVYLDLSSNARLTLLPDWFGNITNKADGTQYHIQFLDLLGNRLTFLPLSIGNLTTLEKLDVSENQLISLPDTIGNLLNLKDLDLSENWLTSLPDTIGNLRNLENLRLHRNNLLYLPPSITQLQRLSRISLYANYLQESDLEMVKRMNISLKDLVPQKKFIWPAIKGEGGIDELERLDILDILNVPINITNSLQPNQKYWEKEFNPRSSQKRKISPVKK